MSHQRSFKPSRKTLSVHLDEFNKRSVNLFKEADAGFEHLGWYAYNEITHDYIMHARVTFGHAK